MIYSFTFFYLFFEHIGFYCFIPIRRSIKFLFINQYRCCVHILQFYLIVFYARNLFIGMINKLYSSWKFQNLLKKVYSLFFLIYILATWKICYFHFNIPSILGSSVTPPSQRQFISRNYHYSVHGEHIERCVIFTKSFFPAPIHLCRLFHTFVWCLGSFLFPYPSIFISVVSIISCILAVSDLVFAE